MTNPAIVNTQSLEHAVARVIDRDVRELVPIGNGGNNRLFRAQLEGGQCFAVKVYWRDARKRLQTEYTAMRFMWEGGVRCVPRPVAWDEGAELAVYEFIDGVGVDAARLSTNDVDQLVNFLAQLKDLSADADATSLPEASDACFSVADTIARVEQRINRLAEVEHAALQRFLADEVRPYFQAAAQAATRDAESEELRVLSPSDYGFHNALRRHTGEWVFLDFEYFGWDDAAKMTADFLLHPAAPLALENHRYFLDRMIEMFGPALPERMRRVLPLHAVAWCARVLNEFLPEHALRRQHAFVHSGRPAPIPEQQLQRSEQMLRRYQNTLQELMP